MKAAVKNYQDRMLRVLDHVDGQLDGDLDLGALSRVAAFSKFHFHRQFAATFGLSVHRYVQLSRLKRASHRLVSGSAQSVTEIAMDAGYVAPDAFAKAFRQRLGQSPSSFRKSPEWEAWLAAFAPLEIARSSIMHTTYTDEDVEVREVADTPVAIMEHRGDRAGFPDTIQRFIAWRRSAGLSPETSSTIMVFRSEREPANADDYSVDLCVATGQPIREDSDEVTAGVIPGGQCAVLRVANGASNNLEPEALFLYRDWLPASGEEARDFPMYSERRLSIIPGTEIHTAVAEVFLPALDRGATRASAHVLKDFALPILLTGQGPRTVRRSARGPFGSQ